MRTADVYFKDKLAGVLIENEEGYIFEYSADYIKSHNSESISISFPISEKKFKSSVLFPFFDGLIPEGWLLEIAEKNWKLNPRDRMGLLLKCCKDCIGAVSIIANKTK